MASLVAACRAVLAASDVLPAHKKALLDIIIWKVTEIDGKTSPRFRSEGALVATALADVRHEHVITRKTLIGRLLDDPDGCETTLLSALACLVTRQEHERLSRVPPGVEGWARYRHAGVRVYDAASWQEVDLTGSGER